MDDNNPFKPPAYETISNRNPNTNIPVTNYDFYPSTNQYSSGSSSWNQSTAPSNQKADYGFADAAPPAGTEKNDESIGGENLAASASAVLSHPVWTWKFWQSFFDVDTSEVLRRMFLSFAPWPRYLKSESIDVFIGAKPDLYGPFWISTTLIFVIAVLGNMASYFQFLGKHLEWAYDFHKVSAAAITVFVYVWIIPLLLWTFLWWRNMHGTLKLTGALCLYGYSMFLYIPISFLWLINIMWVQWVFALTAAGLSGSILAYVFWNHLNVNHPKTSYIISLLVFIAHISLAFGFVGYFFHYARPDAPPISNSTSSYSTPTNESVQSSALIGLDFSSVNGSLSSDLPEVTLTTLPTTISTTVVSTTMNASQSTMSATSVAASISSASSASSLGTSTTEAIKSGSTSSVGITDEISSATIKSLKSPVKKASAGKRT